MEIEEKHMIVLLKLGLKLNEFLPNNSLIFHYFVIFSNHLSISPIPLFSVNQLFFFFFFFTLQYQFKINLSQIVKKKLYIK